MVAKKGEKYKCGKCGMEIVVTKDCKCEVCDIMCCKEPMKKI